MPDTDDEAILGEWRKEAGVPDAVEGYFDNLPEGMEISEGDRPLVENYFGRMHKLGVTPSAAHEGLATLFEAERETREARIVEDAAQKQALDDELYSAYGAEKTGNMNNMEDVLFRNDFFIQAPEGLREKIGDARFDDGTKLTNDPDFMSWMMQAAAVINPQGTVVPSAGLSPSNNLAQEIQSIEDEMHDTKAEGGPSSYWKNPAKQDRYRELIEIRDRQAARG